jgi:uncharacterized phage protein (TIGR02216 family)
MPESFGAGAAALCSAAAVVLGWRPHEFWNATPSELALALAPPQPAGDVPARELIEALRMRFPDE